MNNIIGRIDVGKNFVFLIWVIFWGCGYIRRNVGFRGLLLVGGVIFVGICRWDLKDGVEGREEVMLVGVSVKVFILEGSDFVIGKKEK